MAFLLSGLHITPRWTKWRERTHTPRLFLHSNTIASRLARSQRDQMQDMLRSTLLIVKEMANAVNCSIRTVRTARTDRQTIESVSALKSARGRRSSVPPHVLSVRRREFQPDTEASLVQTTVAFGHVG